MSDESLSQIFERLRETEAQTREQNVRIDNLTQKTSEYLELLKEAMTNSVKREAMFWKAIVILLGAVIVLAVGPKVASELFSKMPVAYYSMPVLPMATHQDDFTKV